MNRGNARLPFYAALLFTSLVVTIAGCSRSAAPAAAAAANADTVYKNGKFIKVGSNAEVEKLIGSNTSVIALGWSDPLLAGLRPVLFTGGASVLLYGLYLLNDATSK